MSKQILHPKTLRVLGFAKQGALSKLTSKRSCQWANRLIVATIEAVEHFETVKDFYYKEMKAEFKDMFSAFLQKKGGFLDLWQAACGACIAEKTPPNEDEAEALYFASGILWQDFLRIFGFPEGTFSVYDCTGVVINMNEVAKDDSKANRNTLKESILNHTFNIAETCYRLTITEWRIWYEHKDWPVDWAEWDANVPFDGRGAVEALYPALKDFDEKNAHAFEMLRIGTNGIHTASNAFPRAFVQKDCATAPARSFEAEVRAILTMKTHIAFRYPADLAAATGIEEQLFIPSHFLRKRRHMFVVLLYARISANARKAPSTVSRRLWVEAEAELLQNITLRLSTYAKEDADRIIELANRAQRESWIERKMEQAKKGDKTDDVEITPPSAEPERAKPAPIDLKAMEEQFLAKAQGYVDGRLAALKNGKGKNGKGNDKKDGSGKGKGRGRQTETTIKQFARFQAYLNKHHVVQHCSLETLKSRVNSFWLENKDEFKAAASKKGQEKGYCSAAMILRAARDKGYGPPSGQ